MKKSVQPSVSCHLSFAYLCASHDQQHTYGKSTYDVMGTSRQFPNNKMAAVATSKLVMLIVTLFKTFLVFFKTNERGEMLDSMGLQP